MEDQAADRHKTREFGKRPGANENHGHHHAGDLRVDRRAVGRVELAQEFKECAVTGHRVVHARKDHDAAVEGIEDREHHGGADNHHAPGAKERIGRNRTEVKVAFRNHLLDEIVGDNLVDGKVKEDVENRNPND